MTTARLRDLVDRVGASTGLLFGTEANAPSQHRSRPVSLSRHAGAGSHSRGRRPNQGHLGKQAVYDSAALVARRVGLR